MLCELREKLSHFGVIYFPKPRYHPPDLDLDLHCVQVSAIHQSGSSATSYTSHLSLSIVDERHDNTLNVVYYVHLTTQVSDIHTLRSVVIDDRCTTR